MQGTLNIHVESVHSNEKKYKCETCGKAFGTKRSADRHHQEVHLHIRNFRCPFCSKPFASKTHLNVHTRSVHFKEKVYPCDMCEQSFAHNQRLKVHRAQRHPSEDFSCQKCGQVFTFRKEYELHMERRHNVLIPKSTELKISTDELKAEDSQVDLTKTIKQVFTFRKEYELHTEMRHNVLIPKSTELKISTDELKAEDSKVDLTKTIKQETDLTFQPDTTLVPTDNSTFSNISVSDLSSTSGNFSLCIVSGSETSLATGHQRSTITSPTSHSEASQSMERQQQSKLKLLIFGAGPSRPKLTSELYAEFKKHFVAEFAQAVLSQSVSPHIDITYDRKESCGVITSNDRASLGWLKKTVAEIKIGVNCFAAWEENEIPKVFEMNIFLPESYDQLKVPVVKSLIEHFNPDAKDTLEIRNERPLISGRMLEVSVGPVFRDFCLRNGGKLTFLMGSISCIGSQALGGSSA